MLSIKKKGKTTALAVSVMFMVICAPSYLVAKPNHSTTLRVGMYQNKPKIFRDHDGDPSGIFVDLLDAIAAREGWAVTYVDCDWKTCLEMLAENQLDLMPDVALTPQRSRRFDFHDIAVVDSFSRVYASPDVEIGDIDDLDDKRIAVLDASVQQDALRTIDLRLDGMTVVPAESFEAAFQSVVRGETDGVLSNHFFGDVAADTHGLAKTSVVMQPAQLYFAAPADTHAATLEIIDRHLDQWQRDNSSPYYAALRKWTTAPPPERIPGWIVYLLMTALGVLAAAALLIFLLRRQVGVRTRHLRERNRELRQKQERLNQTVEALAQSETRAQRIVQGLPIAALVWRDCEGDCELEAMNDAAVELLGEEGSSWRGRRLEELYAPDHPVRSLVEECLEAKRGTRAEVTSALEQDGEVKTLILTTGFLEPDSVLIHLEDVTEHAELQRKMQTTERLEIAGLLAGGVAHDFNNLLTVINSGAELALSQLDQTSPAYEEVAFILEAGTKAAEVTRQLLAFSRNKVVEPQLIRLSETVEQLANMLHHFIAESISLEFELTDAQDWLYLDPSQVEQIVLNLVLNARDAIATHGTIRVSTEVDASAAQAVLEVSDTGHGMNEETLNRVFEPFFTTKEQDRGTGLGLASVYGTVTQAQGTIDVVSEPGKGTTFTVTFPLAAGSEQDDHVLPDESTRAVGNAQILVVEDDSKVRRVVERLVGRAGFEVLTAASVAEAKSVLADNAAIALVLTDVIMPDQGGAKLAEFIEASYPSISILFMSGYADSQLDAHGIDADRHGFVQKPFSSEELMSKIHAALGAHHKHVEVPS